MIIIECYTKKEIMQKILMKSVGYGITGAIIVFSANPLNTAISLAKTTAVCQAITYITKQGLKLVKI